MKRLHKNIRRTKYRIRFTKKIRHDFLYDSEVFSPLGRRDNEKEDIIFPNHLLERKRNIITKFFPDLPKEKTKDYSNDE